MARLLVLALGTTLAVHASRSRSGTDCAADPECTPWCGAEVCTCPYGLTACPAGTASTLICVPESSWCARSLSQNPYACTCERVASLVTALTLQEKVNLLQTQPANSSAVPRLGIPASTTAECLHGYCSRTPSTLFPQSITLAATWDVDMVRAVAGVIAVEARAWRNAWERAGNDSVPPPSLTCFAPQINIVRDPRWGRGQETYGECPTLTAALAAAYVSGLQAGPSPSVSMLSHTHTHARTRALGVPGAPPGGYWMAASLTKHFIAYQGASSRSAWPSPTEVYLSSRDLSDTYDAAWRAAAGAGAAGVMCAYSSLCDDDTNTTCAARYGISHGVPMCANGPLINGWLRAGADGAAPGWDGMVTSDCGAVQFIETDHGWTNSQPTAAAAAIHAGVDFDCSIDVGQGFAALVNATVTGLVNESDIDTAVTRWLRVQFKLGFFDPPEIVPMRSLDVSVVNSPTHRGLAAAAAREGVVLLSNPTGVLPLTAASFMTPGSLLVTGPNAQLVASGNYNTETDLNITALDGILRYVPAPLTVFAPGCVNVTSNDSSLIAAAVAAAANANIVIAVMGIDTTVEYEDDTRASLDLPGVQFQLLSALAGTGTPVVLVLLGGSAMALPPTILSSMSAVIWAGYGGEEAGTALADVLFGAYNPGGRLPITFYSSVDDLPPYVNMSMIGLPYGRTFRYYTGPSPIFRFGDGGSYSRIITGNVSVSPAGVVPACSDVTVTATVQNFGPWDGDEVTGVWVRLWNTTWTSPIVDLAAFTRTFTHANAPTTTLTFTLSPRAFAVVKPFPSPTPAQWWLEPVLASIFVGPNQPAAADWRGAGTRNVTISAPQGGIPLDACASR